MSKSNTSSHITTPSFEAIYGLLMAYGALNVFLILTVPNCISAKSYRYTTLQTTKSVHDFSISANPFSKTWNAFLLSAFHVAEKYIADHKKWNDATVKLSLFCLIALPFYSKSFHFLKVGFNYLPTANHFFTEKPNKYWASYPSQFL